MERFEEIKLGPEGICVSDLRGLVNFYRDVMGFSVRWDGVILGEVRTPGGAVFNLIRGAAPEEHMSRKIIVMTKVMDTADEVDAEYARVVGL